MGSLLIVTGPPGAGKSTVSQLLAASLEPSALVEGDAFFAFLARGAIEPWLPESRAQNEIVTRAAAAATSRFVTGPFETVYDGVLGPWLIDIFLDEGGLASVDYLILLPDQQECVDRVASRIGHGFTDEGATRKMHHEFATASIAARHILKNTGTDPKATAKQIRALRSQGELRYERRGH